MSNSTLHDAIASVLGRNGALSRRRRSDAIGAGRSMAAGLRVLLVDDNSINRQVGAEVLEHAGVVVDLAESGHGAITKVFDSGISYDAVLMDVQMPDMDGLEATQIIRRRLSSEQLPIIALTAHAMDEERQRCLAAGMNDHVAKPIDPVVLVARLARWIKPRKVVLTQPPASSPAPAPVIPPRPQVTSPIPAPMHVNGTAAAGALPDVLPPFNVPEALVRLNGKRDLLKRLLFTFHDEFAGAISQLRRHLDSGQGKDAERLVHTLKSAAASLEAPRIAEAARAVESAIKDGRAHDLSAEIARLEGTLTPALTTIAQLREH